MITGQAGASTKYRRVFLNAYSANWKKITSEGIDQEYADLVSTGVEQNSITNPQLFEGVLFDQAVCSAHRCAVSADISEALFSTARIAADKEFIANDTYYNFVAVLQAGLTKKWGGERRYQ